VVKFVYRQLYPLKKQPRVPLNKKMGKKVKVTPYKPGGFAGFQEVKAPGSSRLSAL
jgi:hypothetical protein